MTQPFHDTRGDLLARILSALENGGGLTDATLDYIDAVLFPPEPGRLAEFLRDETDSGRDSLLDLIFYPDPAVQVGLEPFLDAARCTVADEKDVHDRLAARPIDSVIRMPDGRPLVCIRVPGFVKSQYLARLNVSWQMDCLVAAAIQKGVPGALGPVVRVRLRNAGICPAAGRRIFLGRFFERMTGGDPDYLACLDLALSLLEAAGDDVDVYDLLVGHKRSLFRSLQQARRFDVLLGQSNMETLMLKGVRAPHVSQDALMHHMRLIDLICFGVFGKTEAIDLPVEEPVRQVADRGSPEAVVQSLLR